MGLWGWKIISIPIPMGIAIPTAAQETTQCCQFANDVFARGCRQRF